MKEINSQEDVLLYTADEVGISYEQIKFIERNFWYTILKILEDPLTARHGITIRGFFKFYISIYVLKHKVKTNISPYKEYFQKVLEIWQKKKKTNR